MTINNDYPLSSFYSSCEIISIWSQSKYFTPKTNKIFIQKTYSLNVSNKSGMTNRVRAAENLGSSEHDIIRF